MGLSRQVCLIVVLLTVTINGHSGARGNIQQQDGPEQSSPSSSEVAALRQRAERGDVSAQSDLGSRYLLGKGVRQDYAEAAKWTRKAADQGYATAQYNLGLMHDTGKGVTQDYAEAVRWYRKAAEQGNADAQFELGQTYLFGFHGIPKDNKEAVKWYLEAAGQG